ncbi:LysR family transcriptional regulator, regulator for metE and metH [Tenacibaculum sp. MAR_2009_124]|uniref:LysR family transcriptional regulator n=1 Tax=Tenacibaculum sp. MAR_2009_124 TaxID=1250059 RepID=UPI0008963790|nr:LysR substrate-binding domain-containing protein [Tenacibaculum sp. MAR_2009_124]SEB36499.1 LysR family transcriptional regulator, regulator for metE and metH [Tenacibaculum sp. MAR_2009_124]
MEIKYFRLIKAIAEEGSIANSVGKLFLTQSALSHQLRELEERLGFKVFLRTRNKWELTDEGAELYKLSNEILEKIDISFQNIKQLQNESTGTIKVSTECYSFYQGLPPFVQKMGLLYPEINIDLTLEATHQPIPKVISNEIDIALVTVKPENNALSSIKIHNDEIYTIMHKENPLSEKKFLEPNDFENIHLIIHSFPLKTVSVHEQFLKPNKINPKKISAIPLTEVALEMIQANMGIMCMPKWAISSFQISGDLVFKTISQHGLKRTHYLVYRSSDRSKKYINNFISNFKDYFSKA